MGLLILAASARYELLCIWFKALRPPAMAVLKELGTYRCHFLFVVPDPHGRQPPFNVEKAWGVDSLAPSVRFRQSEQISCYNRPQPTRTWFMYVHTLISVYIHTYAYCTNTYIYIYTRMYT